MKATKHIIAIAGFLLTMGICNAQTAQTDSIAPSPAVADTSTVTKYTLQDTVKHINIKTRHVTPYYQAGNTQNTIQTVSETNPDSTENHIPPQPVYLINGNKVQPDAPIAHMPLRNYLQLLQNIR